MGTWNMAALRHRQTPRRYVKVGPIGQKQMLGAPGATDMVCQGCGVHVCHCAKSTRCMLCEFVDCRCANNRVDGQWFANQATPEPSYGWLPNMPKLQEMLGPLIGVDQAHRAPMPLPPESQRGTAGDTHGPLMLEGRALQAGDILLHNQTWIAGTVRLVDMGTRTVFVSWGRDDHCLEHTMGFLTEYVERETDETE